MPLANTSFVHSGRWGVKNKNVTTAFSTRQKEVIEMTLTRWNPLWDMQSEMNRLRNEMDRLFGRMDGGARQLLSPTEYPAINLWEDDESLFLEAELPGMNLEDLEIFVTGGNQLTISGERQEPTSDGMSWHRRERGFGKFTRVIDLPVPVDEGRVEAHFTLGVLNIRLPKHEGAKPRRITVSAE
jgi:HSP20 family protein